MDSNGYNESILDTVHGEDFITKEYVADTVRHEIFHGTANRKVSKANGFWINVSPQMHQEIHSNPNLDLILKKHCQYVYEQKHSRAEFMELIGRNYL